MQIALTGLSQTGIFRQPGSAGEVRRLSESLSAGQEFDLQSVGIHSLCSVVKVSHTYEQIHTQTLYIEKIKFISYSLDTTFI